MANTIGSAPRPAATAPASSTRASSSAAAAAAPAAAAPPPDNFNAAGQRMPSKIPLGPTIRPTFTADEIKGMSDEQLKGIKGEEVMGMNSEQFRAYQEAVEKDGGIGMKGLDPQASKAILRKNILRALVEDFQRMAEKHNVNFAF